MEDLGYCNGWREYGYVDGIPPIKKWGLVRDNTPEVVSKCRELGHTTSHINLDLTQHGYDTLTTCKECGYCYHTDSSD